MATIQVELPELGESVVEGTVSRWLVKEGEAVERDQPLVEVTTDKVDAEIPAPEAGVVVAILVAEGETVEVGAALATLDTEAEATAGAAGGERPRRETAPQAEREAEAEAERPAAPRRAETPTPTPAPAAGAERGARATPVARRIAEEAEIDLGQVPGSGAAGRVTKSDVLEYARATSEPSAAPRAAREEPEPREEPERRERPRSAPERERAHPGREARRPAYTTYALQPEDRVIPMSPQRRLIAEHMVYSKHTSPHVGTVAEVDLGGVVALRDRHKRAFQEQQGFGLTYLPFIVQATVRALREHPELNASVIDDAIVQKAAVHIGIATETEKGLVVPVVRHADRLSLAGIAAAIDDLSTRARTKKLSPDELQGATFTLSNPGRQGNLYGFAIINQPQVGILRMGEIVKRPVVRNLEGQDAIVIRPMMHLALSYDHRAVDGAPANAFLYRVRELLEAADFDL